MVDVFISYKSEDRALAQGLANFLRSKRVSVWWDKSIRAGDYFDDSIEQHLTDAKAVVVLWSKAALASQWVKAEALSAFGRSVLVSAVIDEVELTYPFGIVQAANLRGWDGVDDEHIGLTKILDGIRAKIRRATPEPAKVTSVPDKENNNATAIEWQTGLRDLDRLIGGLRNGQLVAIAGRPSMGKSTLAFSFALVVAREIQSSSLPFQVLFFALESTAEECANRLLANASGVSPFDLARGKISKEAYQRLVDAAEQMQNLPLSVDDGVSSASEIEAAVLAAHQIRPVGLVVVDSTNLLQDGRDSLRDAAVTFKSLAKRVRAPILLVVDADRRAEFREEGRVALSDIDEHLEQIADLIMIVHRASVYLLRDEPRLGTDEHIAWIRQVDEEYRRAEIVVVKHRNGPIGLIRVAFDPETVTFGNFG